MNQDPNIPAVASYENKNSTVKYWIEEGVLRNEFVGTIKLEDHAEMQKHTREYLDQSTKPVTAIADLSKFNVMSLSPQFFNYVRKNKDVNATIDHKNLGQMILVGAHTYLNTLFNMLLKLDKTKGDKVKFVKTFSQARILAGLPVEDTKVPGENTGEG